MGEFLYESPAVTAPDFAPEEVDGARRRTRIVITRSTHDGRVPADRDCVTEYISLRRICDD